MCDIWQCYLCQRRNNEQQQYSAIKLTCKASTRSSTLGFTGLGAVSLILVLELANLLKVSILFDVEALEEEKNYYPCWEEEEEENLR